MWLECWFLDTEVDCLNPGVSMLCISSMYVMLFL